MFCKSLNSARACLARVSARLGLIWQEYHLGSNSFFSENESLGSAKIGCLNYGSDLREMTKIQNITYIPG